MPRPGDKGANGEYLTKEQHPPAIGDSLDPAHVTLAFEFYSPADACPAGAQLVQFTVRNPARAGDAIVPTQAVPDQVL